MTPWLLLLGAVLTTLVLFLLFSVSLSCPFSLFLSLYCSLSCSFLLYPCLCLSHTRTHTHERVHLLLTCECHQHATGKLGDTTDAAGVVNGRQVTADDATFCTILKSIQAQTDAARETVTAEKLLDYRRKMRNIEQKLLHPMLACQLVGNQAMDFLKQDGFTEIEESVEANHVERKFNDMLLEDEAGGMVSVQREPVFVACVSNFSNFLDLFRKTLRYSYV